MRRARLAAALLATFALLFLLVRGFGGGDPREPVSVAAAGDARPAAPADSELERPRDDSALPGAQRAELEPPRDLARRPDDESVAKAARNSGIVVTLLFRFPNGVDLELRGAHIEWSDEAGGSRRLAVPTGKQFSLEDLSRVQYTLRVEAPGYTHHPQRVDLRKAEPASSSRESSNDPNETTVVLWPEGWVAVLVRTADGRGFESLASDLGIGPKQLFAGAFAVHAQLGPPGPGWRNEAATPVARFHPPPGYNNWRTFEACVGALELLHPPPLWVGLDLYGVNVGWEPIARGRGEVEFRIDAALLEQRFASLALRLVDPASGAPVVDAEVTLRADSSAHRRADLAQQRPDAEGRLRLARIVPGRYELEIRRGESQDQRMLEFAPGEARDLGDVAVAAGTGFDVLVLDTDGSPVEAWVEIGPYAAGARSMECYPQMMRHRADSKGHERLPLPSGLAVVRAAVAGGRSNGESSIQEVRGKRSHNFLIDPAAVPRAPLRLALLEPVEIELTTSRPEGARIEVQDELDLIVARSSGAADRHVQVELIPGRYRARAVAADGTRGAAIPFVVGSDARTIAVD